jgi:hypothetical protein
MPSDTGSVRECAENGVDVARVDVELLGQLIHSDQDDCHP